MALAHSSIFACSLRCRMRPATSQERTSAPFAQRARIPTPPSRSPALYATRAITAKLARPLQPSMLAALAGNSFLCALFRFSSCCMTLSDADVIRSLLRYRKVWQRARAECSRVLWSLSRRLLLPCRLNFGYRVPLRSGQLLPARQRSANPASAGQLRSRPFADHVLRLRLVPEHKQRLAAVKSYDR